MTDEFTCPECRRTSHNPYDAAHGYCAACHAFTGRKCRRCDQFRMMPCGPVQTGAAVSGPGWPWRRWRCAVCSTEFDLPEPLTVPDGPTPPENVRAVYADGRVVPLELIYRGVDEHGMHLWVAPVTLTDPGDRFNLQADMLPANTSVAVSVRLGWLDDPPWRRAP